MREIAIQTVKNAQRPDDIIVTDSAAAKIYELKEEENNAALKLRIFVTGGGCSGFQYGFSFAETIDADDFVFTKDVILSSEPSQSQSNPVIEIVIDAMSMQYLKKARIDYRKDIHGEQFIIDNPNAKTTCGCGSSFSANDPDAGSDTKID